MDNTKKPTAVERRMYESLLAVNDPPEAVRAAIEVYEAEFPPIVLRLSHSEAVTLAAVCCSIGGHPDTTRRGEIDAVRARIVGAGITYREADAIRDEKHGEIVFRTRRD